MKCEHIIEEKYDAECVICGAEWYDIFHDLSKEIARLRKETVRLREEVIWAIGYQQ